MRLKSFKRSQQRQRQQRQAILHKQLDSHLQSIGINLPAALQTSKTSRTTLLGEVIKRGAK